MDFFNQLYYKKQRIVSLWRLSASWLGLGLVFIVFIFLGYHTIGIIRKERLLAREAADLEARAAGLKSENEKLDKSLGGVGRALKIEKIGKADLNLQKPGEEVAIIVFSTSSPDQGVTPAPSFWERVRSFFSFLGF